MEVKRALGKYNRGRSVIVGLVIFIFGLVFAFFSYKGDQITKDYPTTECTIINITVTYDYADQRNEYTVIVEYEIDGTEYSSTFPQYNSSYKIGDVVTAKYDPENPHDLYSTNSSLITFAGIGFAAAGLLIIVVSASKGKRAREIENAIDNNEYDTTLIDNSTRTDNMMNFASGSAEEADFNFEQDGYTGKHFLLKDINGTVLMEAVRTKNAVFVSDYDFINNVTHTTVSHKVGSTTTEDGRTMFARSYFKFDGEEIWNYLKLNGVELTFTGFSFIVKYKGEQIAKGNIGQMQARAIGIRTSTKYLDIVFLCCFAAARCPVGIVNY